MELVIKPLAGQILIDRVPDPMANDHSQMPGLSRGLVKVPTDTDKSIAFGDLVVYETAAANGFKVGDQEHLSVPVGRVLAVLEP